MRDDDKPDDKLFKLTSEAFWNNLVRISRGAVQYAIEMPYLRAQPREMDTEATPSRTMATGGKLDMVERLLNAVDIPGPERVSQYGEAAVEEDETIHKFKAKQINHFLGDYIEAHAGEESDEEEWGAFLSLGNGQLGVLDDALDGTKNYRVLRDAFSSNMCVYRSRGDGLFKLLGGVCTHGNGETMLYDLEPGSLTMISPAGSRWNVSEIGAGDRLAPGTLSIVATRGKSREDFAELLDPRGSFGLPPVEYGGQVFYDPPLETYTTGGAPTMITWPHGECEYLVVPHDQTPYDAAPLPGAILAGHCTYFVAETGAPAALEEIIGWMNIVTGPTGANPRPVKAGLLVREGASMKTTRRILDVVQSAALKRNETR